MDPYQIVHEILNKKPDEKVIKTYPIKSLKIYEDEELKTKRYLTARLIITDKKITIDRLSLINPVPIFVPGKIVYNIIANFKLIWKPQKSLDIPYMFIKAVAYDSELDSLIIETLKEGISLYLTFIRTERDSKEIIKLIDQYRPKR